MQLAVISPVRIMDEIAKITHISLYLHHMLQRNDYLECYRQDDNYKILDNGIYELQRTPDMEEYLDIAKVHMPDEIIAPDVPHSYKKTLQMTEMFIERLRKKGLAANIKIQAVIQARTLDEARECYRQYANNHSIDCIGFPFRLRIMDGRTVLHRKELNEKLIAERALHDNKKHHLLGLRSIYELLMISQMGVIRSCDSSAFYKDAKKNVDYKTSIPTSKSSRKINFDEQGETRCLEQLRKNLQFLQGKM